MARIKAKAITSAPFTTSYKNGGGNSQDPDSYNTQNVNQQQPQTPVQYTYANVPGEGYSNQQVCPPFYPPTMLQAWAPTTPACVDLGTFQKSFSEVIFQAGDASQVENICQWSEVLSVNGLSPQAAFRPLNNNTNRHSYSSRDRPVKTYTPQNYNFTRSEQNRYFNNRGQSTSYLQRQQLHQQPSFHNIVNTNSCGFEYMPYPSTRSRNLHNFGVDMNFFTAPNLYYSKLPSIYPTHASQARHNPVLVPRSQVGLGAINNQDQSYLAVGSSTVMPFAKDTVLNTSSGISSKQSADSQVKENWGPNQRQRGKRWWKENGNSSTSKNFPENSNGVFNKSLNESDTKPESPKFDLETTSFPPLPGCLETDIIDVDVYESRLSDIVKGTVKPATRDTKTQTSESALVCTTKDSSTITIEETVIPTDAAFTPPASPEVIKEVIPVSEPVEDSCLERSEWEDFVDSPKDNTNCSTSINSINVVPEVPATYNGGSSPAFHQVSTNSMVNGSITVTETVTGTTVLPDPETVANVPSEVIENKQASVVKLPKAKQFESLPKNRQCDTPSPKNKTPDASSAKNKFDAFKDRASVIPKHRASFSNSKNADSSSNKERVSDSVSTNSKTVDQQVMSKNTDVFPAKDKPLQGQNKRVLDSSSNKAKALEVEATHLSVNGHVDSESTGSSEDEKPFRKLTYSEVAMRAKEKVEKLAQELKEKERQEAMVRHHRQQEMVAQNKQASTRGPFREFPRGRIVEPRPGPKEWRERRKPARTISLPATGQ
ncbi:uncharacterized protein LOC118199032 isoform X1 [Stegodyphus dumicola]|uniref:uncharacterized protein LOC118199032 isoform X1 n=1 Tax=Stegodyphus dumicola TaxID=202533 RepID=UPI0015A9E6C6|nr:uncharacterized protein LOC118199032 isoform X1 [Stegodyphus dumicola]